jgi:hypothetical protein
MISASTRTAQPLLHALWCSGLLAGAMATAACTEVTPGAQDDETATLIDELGEASCATTPADASFSGRIPDVFSPTTYSNPRCFKAYVVDLFGTSFNDDSTIVEWAGPTDQTSCNDSVMFLQVYRRQGSAWVAQGAKLRSAGAWVTGGGLAFCAAPGFDIGEGAGGNSYRFAASARFLSTGATSRVEFFTHGIIR